MHEIPTATCLHDVERSGQQVTLSPRQLRDFAEHCTRHALKRVFGTEPPEPEYTMSEAATELGLSVHTLRNCWQRRGLVFLRRGARGEQVFTGESVLKAKRGLPNLRRKQT